MHVGVCIPTRGIIFADTLTSLLGEIQDFPYHLYIVSGLPLPDAHNECVRQAMMDGDDITHILFLEEDVVIPRNGLYRMRNLIEEGYQYVHTEYPLEGGSSVFRIGDQIMWTGLGCTLIDLKLFKQKGEPYFTNDRTIAFKNGKMEYLEQTNKYGGHDVLFGMWMNQHHHKMGVVPNTYAQHLRMKSWERKTTNDGTHEIYSL